MLMVNIADVKARLSEFLDAASRGERVLICNRNKPVAELRPVEHTPAQPRDLSPIYAGQTFMTDAFFEPASEADLRDWYENPVYPVPPHAARVAEPRAEYGKAGRAKPSRRRK